MNRVSFQFILNNQCLIYTNGKHFVMFESCKELKVGYELTFFHIMKYHYLSTSSNLKFSLYCLNLGETVSFYPVGINDLGII
jgi:hypothetical protein